VTAIVVSRVVGLAFLIAMVAGGSASAVEGTLTRAALHRERIALPPTAVFEGRGDRVELLVSQSAKEPEASALGGLPASFTGDLPCADCPGIRYQLDLFPDRTFYLRRTYLDRGPHHVFDLIGSFLIAPDGRILLLYGGGAPQQFRIESAERLRRLDLEGRQIASELNYDLTRAASFSPIEPHLAMRGMYRYLADAGLFAECLTGRRLSVAQEADNAALERAYGKARRQPGEELLVTLEGRIAERPKIDGEGKVPMLVVERLTGAWPGETCGARFDTAPLENSYWKLTRLRDQGVLVAEGQREPYLILRPQDHRLSGSGGCNRMTGGYRVEGEHLTFGPVAATMMACPDGMATERAFFETLGEVRSFRIEGEHLELLDAAGASLARLERRLMP
jgi:copper homeostasis protein (lipoprotein)